MEVDPDSLEKRQVQVCQNHPDFGGLLGSVPGAGGIAAKSDIETFQSMKLVA